MTNEEAVSLLKEVFDGYSRWTPRTCPEQLKALGMAIDALRNTSTDNDGKVEGELLNRMKNGDIAARDELISGNLRLVLSVIQRFSNRGENSDDLFQVGCIGLIKAIDNFDVNQQVRLSTYAEPMIIGEVRRYLHDNDGKENKNER